MQFSLNQAVFIAGLTAGVATAGTASAAVLTSSVTPISNTTIAVDDEGTVDWAVWAAGNTTTGAPSASSPTGVAISNVTSDGTLKDVGGSATVAYTYGGATADNRSLSTPLESPDSYLEFQVFGDVLTETVVRVYAGAYRAALDFSASLAGTDPIVIDDAIVNDTTKNVAVFELTFTPDVATDPLTVRLTQDNRTGVSSHVFLEAVTVSTNVVPEPASLALMGIGGLLMARRPRHGTSESR